MKLYLIRVISHLDQIDIHEGDSLQIEHWAGLHIFNLIGVELILDFVELQKGQKSETMICVFYNIVDRTLSFQKCPVSNVRRRADRD